MDNVVYVTRDIERALGLPRETPGYFIITNEAPFVKPGIELDTHELLALPETAAFLATRRDPKILVFKNTPQIERICAERGWRLLNPSASLANRVEEKISQVEWLGELARFLPPHKIDRVKDISWDGDGFILQFNRAHTGLGTIHITTAEDLERVQEQFPERPARVTEFISGPVFTNNNVVATDAILLGNISYQITGLPPFTDNPFATIGNDWGFAKKYLTEDQLKQYRGMAAAIGEKLRASEWKGLFGIDVIIDEQNGAVYLLEINARQPASTTYESQLQIGNQTSAIGLQPKSEVRSPKSDLTTFEAHLAALLDQNLSGASLREISDGAQIFVRNKKQEIVRRMQSRESLMAAHGILNERGQACARLVE